MEHLTEDAIAGAASGLASRVLTAPLDVIKIRYQLQCSRYQKYHSLIQTTREILNEEGVWSLWKGNVPGMHLWVTYSIVQFTSYGLLKSMYLIPTTTLSTGIMNFFCGATASLLATAITYPLDIMRTQFAIQGKEMIHQDMLSFCKSTLQTRGVQGFFAGMSAAMLSVGPYMGLNFGLYEYVNQKLRKYSSSLNDDQFSGSVSFTSGAIAGGLSKTLMYPLDTVKKRLQANVLQNTIYDRHSTKVEHQIGRISTNTSKYMNFRHCIWRIMQEEGIWGFYKGYTPTLLKSVFSTSITFGVFDFVQRNLKDTLE